MSILAPIENLIHKLDGEAAVELKAVKDDIAAKLSQVAPILDTLDSSLHTAITDAAEAASPGLRTAIDTALTTAEDALKAALGL